LEQRDVSLGDRFKEPVFFEKVLVLGMPNEWQMRVKDEREMTGHACWIEVDRLLRNRC